MNQRDIAANIKEFGPCAELDKAKSADRVRAQRTWLYCRFQRDQLSLTLASARHLALHDFERACQQGIDALEAVMSSVESRLVP